MARGAVTPEHEDYSNGVIPGEAAAAVYVNRAPFSMASPQIQLAGLGFGHEKATVSSEEPLLGVGLTGAARALRWPKPDCTCTTWTTGCQTLPARRTDSKSWRSWSRGFTACGRQKYRTGIAPIQLETSVWRQVSAR